MSFPLTCTHRYYTWNSETFFFAIEASDVGTRSRTTFVGLYVDADPRFNPFDGEGTSSGKAYDYHTASLPFNADFYIEWLVGFNKATLYYYEGKEWSCHCGNILRYTYARMCVSTHSQIHPMHGFQFQPNYNGLII
jgi:hypothetical protein